MPQGIATLVALGALLWTVSPGLLAGELQVPITLDYRILDQALDEQLLSGPGNTAELFTDGSRCNSLRLSNPRIEGTDDGQVRILTDISTRTGIPTGNHCMLPLEWNGVIETRHQAYIDRHRPAIDFRIVDSGILETNEQTRAVPGVIWNWIKDFIQPRFDAVSVDLAPAVGNLQDLLQLVLHAPQAAGARVPVRLALHRVTATPAGLNLVLRAQLPDPPPNWTPASDQVLTEAELAHWDTRWQAWDGFATWLIKTLGASAEPELARALADLLLQARYDLRDALADDDRARDPVRDLFLNTWERLAPLLHDTRPTLPAVPALQYATFVSAADALSTLDRIAPHLGVQLDRNSLRSFARLLVPRVSDDALEYGTEVDPALRALLGLDPEFNQNEEASTLPFAWLIPAAHAGQVTPALVARLTGWVPAATEIDDYLGTMAQLLDQVILAERSKGKVPGHAFDIYATLLRTTAWQESCWRQYVRKNGQVNTIQSPGGAIGLMQINRHVWRGVYNLDALGRDVGYNARAGNEILVHYLVDFAIKHREDQAAGDPRALARAAYGVYNGGPRHLERYRKATTSKHLKAVDDEFWKKYQAMDQRGPAALRACYGI
ncbi:lytic transglycosylase domain-containing protein [Marinobacterium rhizophilum]|uniref:Transglycosylase SLT domain-containing protein n=1 Tax=Marinobacterium rhizophilum TaxID=420402 RepID=A0ABY5HFU8_9GAMM|nr:lytic transglycosylase domain-containing protein [Marinobacterium rhizophilum]UTW11236.1 hypothetical protein KDW95_18480 [Marinobacterium rhizophilum]